MAKPLARAPHREAPRRPEPDYEADFFAWTQTQADLLRRRQLDRLDLANLAQEIEDMGKRDRRELRSRLRVLLLHLLKWQHQTEKRSASWRSTIHTQRQEIHLLLDDSPSLRRRVAPFLRADYAAVVREAAAETGLDRAAFPEAPPYSAEQVLDDDFWPDPAAGSGAIVLLERDEP